MNSICRGNNENPLSVLTITQSRETACRSRAEKFFFFFSTARIYAEMCANSIRHIRCKISIRPHAEEVGHPVPYVVPPGTIYMIIRSVAEKHLSRCGGQGGWFFGGGKRNSACATRWATGARKSAGQKSSRIDEYQWHHLTLYTRQTFIMYIFYYSYKIRCYPNGNRY